jgi:CubicO group peptidase (beta-lactamase class C family)
MSVAILALLLASSSVDETWPGKVWSAWASPEAAGYSSEKLEQARQLWESVDSAAYLVIVDGAVLASWGEVERRFQCHSVRKSLLSALYGIYEGEIDFEATLAELEIDDREGLSDTEKQARVIDLISSRSGIYHPAAYEPQSMKNNRPARGSQAPGTHWWYNNWDFNTAAVVFEQRTGSGIFEAFEESLAQPLGLQHYRTIDGYYHLEKELSNHPAYPFRMSALDLARIGLLYERRGRWQDEQILSEGWIDESTSPLSKTGRGRGRGAYGYMWWVDGSPEEPQSHQFHARGTGGQTITVVPALDLVLVNRTNTYLEKSVGGSDLARLQIAILQARQGKPGQPPQLTSLQPKGSSRHNLIQLEDAQLKGLQGTWNYPSGWTVSIEARGDQLIADLGVGTYALLPETPTRFWVEDVQLPLLFEEQSDGSWQPWVEFLCALEAKQALDTGDRKALAHHLERAARLFPESATANARYGTILYEQGEKDRALALLRKAIEIDPEVEDADQIRKVLSAADGSGKP